MAEPNPKKTVRTCTDCSTRMSSLDFDPHLLCINCRGIECNLSVRCDICRSWSEDKMKSFVKHQASLQRKRKSKQKSKEKKVKLSESDFSKVCTGNQGETGVLSDETGSGVGAGDSASSSGVMSNAELDAMMNVKLIEYGSELRQEFTQEMNSRIESLEFNIITAMNQHYEETGRGKNTPDEEVVELSNESFSAPQDVPGQLLSGDERPTTSLSRPPTGRTYQGEDRDERVHPGTANPPPVSQETKLAVKNLQYLLAQGLITDVEFGRALARLPLPGSGSGSDDQTQPGSSGVPRSQGSSSLPPSGLSGAERQGTGDGSGNVPRRHVVIGGAGATSPNHSEDGSENPITATAEFHELWELVVSFFPQAKVEGDRPPPPKFLAKANEEPVPVNVSGRFGLYDRLKRLKEDLAFKVKAGAKESKKASTVLPRRRGAYKVVGEDALTPAPPLNELYRRLTFSKPSNNASVSVPLEELRRLEGALVSLQETQSFSFWLVAALFEYLRSNGFVPPDGPLFSRLEDSLSLALVDQARTALSLSAFSVLTRRAHFLKFASLVPEGQKAKLLGSDPFGKDLFDGEILEEIVKDFEGAQATSSHINVSKAVTKGLFMLAKAKGDKEAPSQSTGGKSPVVAPGNGNQSRPDAQNSFDASSRGSSARGRGARRPARSNFRSRGGGRYQRGSGRGSDFSK